MVQRESPTLALLALETSAEEEDTLLDAEKANRVDLEYPKEWEYEEDLGIGVR